MNPALKSLVEAAAQEFYSTVRPVIDDKQLGMLLLGMAFNRLKLFGVTRTEVIKVLEEHWPA